MASKQMKRSTVTGEMQIKTTPCPINGGKKILAKIWNTWNSRTLLLGLEIGIKPFENG